MAQGKARRKEFNVTLDLQGVLTTSVRAQLVTEFIKDVLYQRQQFSMPFEEIKQDVVKSEQSVAANDIQARHIVRPSIDRRKKKMLVDSVTELTAVLHQIFALPALVRSVLLVLGPTIVGPKESYLLKFPTSVFDGHILSLSHCKTTLFRHLVLSPFFEVQPPKSCTKLAVLVELQDVPVKDIQLIPKPNFKIPIRGCRLDIDFVCHTPEVSGDLTKVNEADFDISGIEPLNLSVLDYEHVVSNRRPTSHGSEDLSMSCSSPGTVGTPQSRDHAMDVESSLTPHRCFSPMLVCDTPNPDNTSMNFSWFQIPVCVHGYRDRTVKSAPSINL